MFSDSRLKFFHLLLIGFCCQPFAAWADDPQFIVHIRTIEGSAPEGNKDSGMLHRTASAIDSGLEDLRARLEHLRFTKYKLISDDTRIVSLNDKDTINLGGGHTVSFKPIASDEKKAGKMCLWLHWKDGAGTELLDTRIHFRGRDVVLTGTDESVDKAVMLAIKVQPK